MKLDTFFEKCTYITVIMFIFTLIFNFVMGLGIFTTVTTPSGATLEGNTSILVQQATISTDYPQGIIMDNIWSIALTGGIGTIVLAILTQSTTIIGVYLFCFVFWSAYINLISILSIGSFLTGNIWGFIAVGTAGMIFVFIAAVIGMLSGSG